MSLSEDLAWRGLIKDKTFENITWLDTPRTFYHGVDASSADSMTIGNLAAMLMARRLLDAGWQAVLLAGGATSLIGDPKENEERELKPREEVEHNVEAIKKQINKLFSGKTFTPVDNYDWFKNMGYLDFLRDVGKSFAMSELMQREFVTERLASGISYAEFSYSLIQGYDYWQMHKKHNVELQIGGSDQWGNMLSGVSLVRKKEGKEVHALSMPLVINKATGRKFGKSEGGGIWLDPNKTTPTQFYQFWINTDDADVEDFLKIFTLLSKKDIENVMALQRQEPAQRAAQKKLAEEVTRLVHGSDSGSAQGVTKYLTSQVSLDDIQPEELEQLRKEIPSIKVREGDEIAQALVDTRLVSSKREGREIRSSGGIYINGEGVTTEHFHRDHFQNGRLLLRRGKAYRDSALIELE